MRGIFPKSKTKKHIAGFFLGLVIVNLLASSATAFAQQSYKDYEDLFKPASLTFNGPIVNQTAKALTGFKFIFKWDFEAKPEGQEFDANWHWDHVASPTDVDSSKTKQFVVRFCNTDSSGIEIEDDKCFFSEVPYAARPEPTFDSTSGSQTASAQQVYNATKDDVLYRAVPSTSGSGNSYSERNTINVTARSFFAIDSADNINSYALPAAFDGRRYHASLWYCAGNPSSDVPTNKSPKPPTGAELVTISAAASNIQKFGELCDGEGRAYFKIAETPVFVAKSFDTAAAEAAGAVNAVADANAGQEATQSPLPSCHPLNGFGPGSGSLLGCVAVIAYYTLFKLAAFFAWLMGQLFDFFIGYSISDEAYRHEFIDTAWRLVRDICNIFFILILVYTGLMVVFQTNKYNLKNIVAAVIINALIINFSLLITRIGIDLSNVATRVFYNQVEIKRDGVVVTDSSSGYKPISEAIVSSFNPQRIFQNANLLNANPGAVSDKNDDGFSGQIGGDVSYDAANLEVESQQLTRDDNEYAGYFLLVTLMAAVISFSVGLMFWKVSFMFLGRVVGLYVMMIFSPVAFLTRSDKGSLPLVGGIPKFGWKNWTSEYGKYLALAPIFVLYLYVLNSFFNLTMYNSLGFEDARTQSIFAAILYIVIPMLVVYGLIRVGVKLAENYAGEFGSEISNKVNGLVAGAAGIAGGAAIGVATGGLGLVGRQVGMAGRAIQQKTKFGDWAQRNQGRGGLSGGFAKFANKTFERSQNASFDPRNTALMGKFTGLVGKQMGINLKTDNAVTSALKLGSDKTKGGLNAYDKRRKEEDEKRVEDVKTSYRSKEDAQNNYNKVLASEFAKGKENADVIKENLIALNDPKMKKLKEEAEKDLKQQLKDKVIASYSTADIDNLAKNKKKKWEEENPEFIKEFNNFKENQSKKYGAVKDNDTLTQAMRLRYAEQVKNAPSTTWDYVRGLAMVNGPDISHKLGETEKNMEKYISDKQKQIKKETAANESLKKVNEDLNTIIETMAKTHTEFEKFKKNGKYDHTTMDDDQRIDMIKARRAALQTELDLGTEGLAKLKAQYDTTGDEADKNNYKEALMKRNQDKEDLENLKGIVNRYEKALEKAEKTSEKPKDESKDKPKT